MSKINCVNCKYYDFNDVDGVDWCRLNHYETGICGNCDREFEDLEEAIVHYDAVVEENDTFLMYNSRMAGEIDDLKTKLAITEKALELCERHHIGFENATLKEQVDWREERVKENIKYFINKAKETKL